MEQEAKMRCTADKVLRKLRPGANWSIWDITEMADEVSDLICLSTDFTPT